RGAEGILGEVPGRSRSDSPQGRAPDVDSRPHRAPGVGGGAVTPGTLHVFVAAADPADGKTGMGVVFVDSHGRALRKVGGALPGVRSRALAAFRGIVYALWNSRRLGTRRVIVHCPDQDVVAQITGAADVAEELIGP